MWQLKRRRKHTKSFLICFFKIVVCFEINVSLWNKTKSNAIIGTNLGKNERLMRIWYFVNEKKEHLNKFSYICTVYCSFSSWSKLIRQMYVCTHGMKLWVKCGKINHSFHVTETNVKENVHAQKRPKICTCCRVSEAKFSLCISQY